MTESSERSPEKHDRSRRLSQLILEVVDRQSSGENVDDQGIIDSHPDLMPELGEKLHAFRAIQEAEVSALSRPDHEISLPGENQTSRVSIPGYRIGGEGERGGQGVVYRATQLGTGKEVAIKVVREGLFAGEKWRARFDREIRVLGHLRHPNIVTIHESGVTENCHYFVMDYIAGCSLDEYFDRQRRSIADSLRLFSMIGHAVSAAHLRGVIHRDIKPGNIRIDQHDTPFVLDFGLAKWADEDRPGESFSRTMTEAGQFLGSLAWAAPEQLADEPERVDLRSDVYSLGVLLFHMLTGSFPYTVDGPAHATMDNILNAEPTRPGEFRSEINHELDTIILKCLAKAPERRYQTAGDLARDVDRLLANEPIEAKRDSTLYVLRKQMARHRGPLAVAVTILILLIGSSVVAWTLFNRSERARSAELLARLEAEAVSEFMVNTLKAVNPLTAKGKEVTVREMLDRAALDLADRFADRPLVDVRMRWTIGETYHALGAFDKAEAIMEAAYQTCSGTLADHAECKSNTQGLARLHIDAGNHQRAQFLLRESINREEATTTPSVAALASLRFNLASSLWQTEDLDEAESSYRASLEERGRIFQPNHADVAESLSGLALFVSESRGRYEEAEGLARRALEIQLALRGQDDPSVTTTQDTLAMILRHMGRLDEAAVLYDAALDTRRRLYGDHASTASTMSNLAGLYKALGQYDEAEALYRDALEIMRESLGAEDSRTLGILSNLANILKRLGKHDEAESLYRKVLEINPNSPATLNNLGSLLLAKKDHAGSIVVYRKALAAFKEWTGPDHPNYAYPLLGLGEGLLETGEVTEAEGLLREALALRRQHLPEGHRLIGDALSTLGACLTASGMHAEAKAMLNESIQILQNQATTDKTQLEKARARLESVNRDHASDSAPTGHIE